MSKKIHFKKYRINSNKNAVISDESASHSEDLHSGHVHEGRRPRNLGVLESLFHLDADWGTSLAYILPLSLALTGRLAPIYMLIIGFIMWVVANGYKVVCRRNPDGGGVYSSLRKVNQFLAVVGALLLITDYIVTQALSITDAFHYLQLPLYITQESWHLPQFLVVYSPSIWTIVILIILTVINWKGPHFSAKFAGVASSATFFLAGLLSFLALPFVPSGLANIGHFNQSIGDILRNTTGVLLALSGVEAISNMTGIMKDPEKTSKLAINLELIKVLFTTIVLGIAMNGLPPTVTYIGHTDSTGNFVKEMSDKEISNLPCYINRFTHFVSHQTYTCPKVTYAKTQPDMLVAMGEYLLPGTIGKIYGTLLGVAYGLLLIFAGNTALIDITNVTYALACDNELPVGFTKLNSKYGVPIWGLVTAGIAPILTILFVGANVEALAALYAIGVVGAVTLNLAGTTLQASGKERVITGFGAILMCVLFITLAYNKMEATLFASLVLIIGLLARSLQKHFMKHIVGGIEPMLTSNLVSQIESHQVLVPVYEEFDPSLFSYVGNFAKKYDKKVVLLYLHEVDTLLEINQKQLAIDDESKKFIKRAKKALAHFGIDVHTVIEFTDLYGDTINHYRKKLNPETTILSPRKQSTILDFLKGNTIKKVFSMENGTVLLYTNGEDKK